MKKKDTLLVGLMLFSMFFGAGNLIFPPFLGSQAGTAFWPAIIGFVLTGVGLPVLVLVAIALSKNGVRSLGNYVHPKFGFLFTIIVYLSIGPFFGIPRNANVAFEMGLKPYLGNTAINLSVLLLIFTVIFFGLVYLLSLNPTKVTDYMGKFLTPTLLLSIISLCVIAFIQLDQPLQTPADSYQTAPFIKGFIDGYSTMDALAALAFGIVVVSALQQKGVVEQKQQVSYTLKTGLVAGTALAIVYVALGWLGASMTSEGPFENGTALLSTASNLLLGKSGIVLLGIIFTLACFTTCVGLTISCGHYFNKLFPKISYKVVVTLVTVVSFLVANLGLNQIIAVSIPFLVMAYPLTIVLVVLAFFHRYFNGSQKVYGLSMLFTGVFAVYDGLKMFGLEVNSLNQFVGMLPLSSYGLAWVVPALLGLLLGVIWARITRDHSVVKVLETRSQR
ncbi:branched-chain amino acid transport system II carrier protein [Neobacillus sp. D3-1R]|uniref:branched-chain amino acid transport system II carrier protein n=1 Tax=Neobacillus sp. D3-1R TaxID=3445778 RepID=UPI003F9F2B09